MDWHLLIVDDEPLNLEIIGELLDAPNYRLSFADNGEVAWNVLIAANPAIDLIVLDRMMPVLDGLSLLKRIKADERFCNVPVIMQTAASAPEEVREGIEAGAYYYLTKPYQPESLLAIVAAAQNRVIEQRGLETARQRQESALQMLACGDFEFSTLDQAQALGGAMALLCRDPAAVALGLTELLVNAVEHGNLGICYAEKKRLRQAETWEAEVARRLAAPEYAGRKARLRIERDDTEVAFTIEDQGRGFAWERYLEFDAERAFDPNGRGIAMARQIAFSRLEYRGCGNVVVARVERGDLAAADG